MTPITRDITVLAAGLAFPEGPRWAPRCLPLYVSAAVSGLADLEAACEGNPCRMHGAAIASMTAPRSNWTHQGNGEGKLL